MEVEIKFSPPLREATLLARRKRFLADVQYPDGKKDTALCPNTGTMKSCCEPGRLVMLSYHPGTGRQYPYTMEMIKMADGWVGVDTHIPNNLVSLAVKYGMIPELISYPNFRREVKYGEKSRIDLLLEGPPGRCYVEVKNVSLREGKSACFPDAVSERGTKHLNELMNVVRHGDRAVMLFLVQRSDVQIFRPADHIDPVYGDTLRKAADSGVEILVYNADVSPERIRWGGPIPKDLSKFDGK